MSEIAISVENVWKNFRLYHERNRYLKAAILRGRRARYEEFWALEDVSFEVKHGATLGIIGANGSGKSTMLKCLAGILYPNKGSVTVSGRLAALLELGAGFHHELSGRENIFLNGAILGMSRRDLEKRYDDIVSFAGLEKFIDTPVKNFSSGMTVRLGFSIAAHVEPEILLIDEVLSVGDQSFQRRSMEKIEEFRRDGRTIIFVSHGMSQVEQLCNEIVWLDKGKLRKYGRAPEVIAEYLGDSYEANVIPQPDSGRRWGNGKAAITSVRVLNANQELVEQVNSLSFVRVEISYDALTLIEDLVVFVKITTLNGTEVWATSTRNNGSVIPHVRGPGLISLDVESLPLLEGSYFLTVALRNNRETVEFDHWENARRLDVHQVGRFDTGIVGINATWITSSKT
jgi:ABC-2 type transport system ATP-binding protein